MSTLLLVFIGAFAAWLVISWTFAKLLAPVDKKLDDVLAQLEGLRQYLYEIDPQFDDERASNAQMEADRQSPEGGVGAMFDSFLMRDKEDAGKRTLNTRF